MASPVSILATIVLALGAVEATAYWWMHPAPAGRGQPVLVYQPSRSAGVSPNTVILDDHDGGLANFCDHLCAALPYRKLGARFRFDRALLAPTSTARGTGFSEMPQHLGKHGSSCFRGKCSGLGLFAWI